MPQELTHNPLSLKVGDTVWILNTTKTIIKLEQEKIKRINGSHIMKPMQCRIIKITQRLKENNAEGTGGPRKRLFEYHIMPTCTDSNSTIIYATHTDEIFHSLEELNESIKEKMKKWNKINKDHEKRHEKIEDIIYIKD